MLIGFLLAAAATIPAGWTEILAVGPVNGGSDQAIAVCHLFNAGGSAVPVSSIVIYDSVGAPVASAMANCGTSLPAHKQCGVVSSIAANTSYACRAVVGNKD